MKIRREVSGAHLAEVPCRRWQYTRVHQTAFHGTFLFPKHVGPPRFLRADLTWACGWKHL
jgi:hypothetical protein